MITDQIFPQAQMAAPILNMKRQPYCNYILRTNLVRLSEKQNQQYVVLLWSIMNIFSLVNKALDSCIQKLKHLSDWGCFANFRSVSSLFPNIRESGGYSV